MSTGIALAPHELLPRIEAALAQLIAPNCPLSQRIRLEYHTRMNRLYALCTWARAEGYAQVHVSVDDWYILYKELSL